MINGISRSILLQVAFKEAAADRRAQPDSLDVKAQTAGYFQLLVDLHGELNIDPDDGNARRSGGGGGGSRPTTIPSAPAPTGETFIFKGHLIEDFRAAKAAPGSTVNPKYPDFKTVNGQPIEGVTTPQGAAWLDAQDGAPNEAVSELVTAADQKII
jgi:hypothetical protein